ncbi:MAG TPA: glycerol-3-phosphate 1-O-acyltransferase PlsY [Candidatus Hungatella pullicola]|nr:glycerol-3-phosphate 1-O-acyltransferase PlsY [Candidatus Hungatella pullicola]
MERVICLVIGYLCGLFQTGYLYGKAHNIDIRNYGSGNSGTTNALRVLGWKAGVIVFLGDFLKTLLPCLAVKLIFAGRPDMQYLLMLYTGLGVVLGHNYPVYLKFRGGKGIAATAGLLTAMDIRMALICLLVFAILVGITRYVSLGSLVVVTIFFAWLVIFGAMGQYGVGRTYLPEFYIVAAVITFQAFWRHRANIVRLSQGTENKIGSGKKKAR